MRKRSDSAGRPGEPDESPGGMIVAHHGISVEVLFDDGSRRMARVKRNSGHVVGDRVLVTGERLTRLPRHSELRRRDARGGVHLVAANLDLLGIVVAPSAQTAFIDRAMVAAHVAGLEPCVVINKCDLAEGASLAERLVATYDGIAPLFPLSAATGSGLSELREFLGSGRRAAFVGSTGVGKSSLLNALCPHVRLQVGETGDYRGMGRHTTTVATLHRLPEGGELVDTPGFRDFGLVDISPQELADHFPGFRGAELRSCRFRDCRHRHEPGCAVVEALRQGRLPESRYATYRSVLDEVEADGERSRIRGRS